MSRAAQPAPPGPAIVVLTAPSGSGKTTIAHRILRALPALRFSVSLTTRPARPHEIDGTDYHFVTPEAFEAHRAAGELVEAVEVYPGRWYGTLRSEIADSDVARPVLLDIDVLGALRVKELFGPAALTLFIRPPSMKVLEQRLSGRGTEDPVGLKTRLDRAAEELSMADRFDRVVVNDELEEAVRETRDAIDRFLRGPDRPPEASGEGEANPGSDAVPGTADDPGAGVGDPAPA